MHAIKEIDTIWIPLKDGCNLAARVWLPEDAEQNPVPAILEYLPYRRRDGTLPRDEMGHPYVAAHGYACVRVDIRGTGDSDGLLFDEYTEQELSDAEEVITWLTEQAWCSGNVGMMGISWGGFNSLQVAARQPEALKAIITVCSTADRFETDIHYKGGALLLENLGWASTMLSYQSRPPDPQVVGERWKAMWLERLENMPLLLKNWLEHASRDEFWKHGSICEDYGAIKAATLAVGGWYDAYSNTVFRLLENLSCPKRGIVGPWAHKYPHYAIPKPQIGFLQESIRWWDRWLKGIETNIIDEPLVRLYKLDSHPPKNHHEQLEGQWLGFENWPATEIESKTLYLGSGILSESKQSGTITMQSPENTGTQAGEFCIIWLGPEWSLEQRPDDALSTTFDITLTEDLHLVGAATLKLRLKSQTPHANLAVRLNDIHPDGQITRVTYGILNLCHRNSNEQPEALPLNDWVAITLKLDEIAYSIPKNHRLRVSISSAYYPLIWPSADKTKLELDLKNCSFSLPLLTKEANTNIKFLASQTAELADIEELELGFNKRSITHDVVTNTTTTHIIDDYGKQHIKRYDLITKELCEETYSINADDPLSATATCSWLQGLERNDWQIYTETKTTLTCDKDFFYIKASLKAFERETLVYEQDWQEKVKRSLL